MVIDNGDDRDDRYDRNDDDMIRIMIMIMKVIKTITQIEVTSLQYDSTLWYENMVYILWSIAWITIGGWMK